MVAEALCGIEADADEAPDLAVICEECDAAINFDTLLEEMDQET